MSSAALIGATRPFLFNSRVAARIGCADSVFIVLLSRRCSALKTPLFPVRYSACKYVEAGTCTWTNITEMYLRQYLERNRDSFGRVELRRSTRNCTMKEIACWLPRKTQNQQATPGAQW
jgi:hypothetical protein